MFIRVKYIKNKPYGYLVKNTWKAGKTTQKVKKYLGRVFEIPEKPAPELPENVPTDEIVPKLLKLEAPGFDFTKYTVKRGARSVVLALNGGFLCDYTLKNIYKSLVTTKEEQPGSALAKAFQEAGLRIPKKHFVRLYLEKSKNDVLPAESD